MIKKFGLVLFLFGAILVLGKTVQASGKVKLFFEERNYKVKKGGDTAEVILKVDSGNNKVDLVALDANYGEGLQIEKVSLGALPEELNVDYGNGQMAIEVAKAGKWRQLPDGEFRVAAIKVRINSAGKINLTKATVNGCIPKGSSCNVTNFLNGKEKVSTYLGLSSPLNLGSRLKNFFRLITRFFQ